MIKKLIVSSYVVTLTILVLVGVSSLRVHQQLEQRNATIDESAARCQQIEILLAEMNRWDAARSLEANSERSQRLRVRVSELHVWQAFLSLESHYRDETVGRAEITELREQLLVLIGNPETHDGSAVSTAFTTDTTIQGMQVALTDLAQVEISNKETNERTYRHEARKAVRLLASFGIVTLSFLLCAIILSHRETARRAVVRKQLHETNAELEERVAQQDLRATELELMTELGEQLQVCRHLSEAGPVVSSYLPLLFPSSRGVIYVTRESDHAPELLVEWGFETPSPRVIETSECWGLRSGRIHQAWPGSSIPCAHSSGAARSWTCIPMHAGGGVLGLLHLDCPLGESLNIHLGKPIAEHLSLGLANIRLRESLSSRAIRDPLTNLFNRRYLEEKLTQDVHRAMRQGTSFTLAMLDVDHFKAFNDTFGHAAGDAVLERLANLMQSFFRDEDTICRYGGEEFLVLLSDTTPAAAMARVEELRMKVKGLVVRLDGVTLGAITISAGLAAYPNHGSSADMLIAEADRMVYRAKHDGRDRIVIAAEPAVIEMPPRAIRAVSGG